MSNSHGGAGRGQGRKPLAEKLVSKTVTIFERQAERMIDANLSEVVRRLIDKHLEGQDARIVTLWEDGAGGCWLVDPDREWAWDMGLSGEWGASFVQDASASWHGDTEDWGCPKYQYELAIAEEL